MRRDEMQRGKPLGAGQSTAAAGDYVEFALDPDLLAAVEDMARKSRRTPFEMCVILLMDEMSCVSGAR
jgi:hypothetical protein